MPNSFLRKKASAVNAIDNDIKHILDDMLETMYNANGIGLAATQIEIDKRLIVMDCGLKTDDDHLEPNPIKMINPEITFLSKNFNEREEGCLSIPGHHAIVKRPDKVIVNYRDENFKQKEFIPAVSEVPVSGKVIGALELKNMVEASLDGWLTSGRFNEQFEKSFNQDWNKPIKK